MKNPLYLAFILFNILVISCANKGVENESEKAGSPTESKIMTVLNKKFNSVLEAPSIAPAELTASEKAAPGALIKGTVEGAGVKSVYLHEITKTQLIIIDSVQVDNTGNFVFKTSKFSEPTICFLTFNSANPPGIPIVVGKDTKVSLAIRNSGWIMFEAKGDKHNLLMNELYTIYLNHDKNLQDFNREISEIDPTTVTDSLREAVGTKFQTMQKLRTDDIVSFVNTKEGSPASYYAVTFLFQEPMVSLMQTAYDKLKVTMPTSKYTKELEGEIQSVAPLEIGGLAPEIKLKSPDGKEVKLSSLRGKVVLIDFWASWCGPCRRENPNVVRVYNKYKSKGFEILGVSLDDDAAKWQGAIAKDGLTWKQVSDLKGWQSSAAQTYQVNSIPFTVLLDKNGRIIAKGLRGQELEEKLAELLK